MRSLVALTPETPSPEPFKPWNLGKLIGQKPPLKLREVWAIRIRLQIEERLRDLAMFNLAIDSKLRGCDLVAHSASRRGAQPSTVHLLRDGLLTTHLGGSVSLVHLVPIELLAPDQR